MPFWAYILRCSDGSYYTGHTDNLEARIGAHQVGGTCGYTSKRRPVEMVWCQEFPARLEALEAEMQIKPWSRKKKEGLIAGNWEQVSFYAKPPRERPSTSLGTNGSGLPDPDEDQAVAPEPKDLVRAERSRGTPPNAHEIQ